MKPEWQGRDSNWKLGLVVGAGMILLGLWTATGAVSLQSSPPGALGPTVVTGLAYSGWVFGLSIVLSALGMLLVFFAGRDRR
jgi:hypothetical protein